MKQMLLLHFAKQECLCAVKIQKIFRLKNNFINLELKTLSILITFQTKKNLTVQDAIIEK